MNIFEKQKIPSDKIILLLLWLFTSYPCSAEGPVPERIREASDAYGLNQYSRAWKMTGSLLNEGIGDYWKIRLTDLRGLIKEWSGDKKAAISLYQKMEELALNSKELEGTAYPYAFSAMATLRQMGVRNKFYALANISKVESLCDKALAIDPENKIALLVRAQELIRVPKVLGGNAKQALALLDKVPADSSMDNNLLFTLYYSYAYSWYALDDMTKAVSYLNKAFELYPGNNRGEELQKMIDKNLSG
jgi:tetratricopeptide (TPR) repeat protein